MLAPTITKGTATMTIEAGYIAYNGHVFTKAEAEAYMQACRDAERNPSEFNLDQRHRVFVSIITRGQFYNEKQY